MRSRKEASKDRTTAKIVDRGLTLVEKGERRQLALSHSKTWRMGSNAWCAEEEPPLWASV
jgi:hypothetical protein